MTRFFVTPEELNAHHPVLTGENANHARVLRLKAGEEVLLCDGEGTECFVLWRIWVPVKWYSM